MMNEIVRTTNTFIYIIDSDTYVCIVHAHCYISGRGKSRARKNRSMGFHGYWKAAPWGLMVLVPANSRRQTPSVCIEKHKPKHEQKKQGKGNHIIFAPQQATQERQPYKRPSATQAGRRGASDSAWVWRKSGLMRNGKAEPSHEKKTSGVNGDRGKIIFPVQRTASRIDKPYNMSTSYQ